jgi:hypothetical protein
MTVRDNPYTDVPLKGACREDVVFAPTEIRRALATDQPATPSRPTIGDGQQAAPEVGFQCSARHAPEPRMVEVVFLTRLFQKTTEARPVPPFSCQVL